VERIYLAITKIPERYRRGLSKLRILSDQNIAELCSALGRSQATSKFSNFSATVAGEIKGIKKEDVDDILQSLYSLSVYRVDSEEPIAKVVSDVAAGLRVTEKGEPGPSDQEELRFKERLSKILSIDSLSVAAKAAKLKIDYSRNFCDAKVFSDIRPVFAAPDQKPIGTVVTHTLRVEYHENGEHKEFYVALDGEELGKLRKAIERAELKAASLRSLIKEIGIIDFDRP
jgi:hypothetical protein